MNCRKSRGLWHNFRLFQGARRGEESPDYTLWQTWKWTAGDMLAEK